MVILTVAGTVRPSSAAATSPPLWIGANVNVPDNSIASFNKANVKIGPLRYRRCFGDGVVGVLPTTFQKSCASADWANGYRSFVSWKPPRMDYGGAAAGTYDAQITTWAKSVPPTIGVYATVWHEPEENMTGQQYVAMFQHVYSVVKAANPSITFGPVYMSYWWEEGTPHYAKGGPDAWWVWSRYADFVGVDTYAPNPTTLRDNRGFQGWLNFVNLKAPTKPLVVAEYGQCVNRPVPTATLPANPCTAAEQAERARMIPLDEVYLRSMRFTMWLYWHGTGDNGDWSLTDPASQAAWRSVASSGRRS